MRITQVRLYDSVSHPHVSMEQLASFIHDTFGIPAESHMMPHIDNHKMDSCRVRSIFRPPEKWGNDETADIPLYDGHLLHDHLGEYLSHRAGVFHILFVDVMIGTYDYDGMRYHGRALLSANPCIISVRGMCEAPARSTTYCADVMACMATGRDVLEVDKQHGGGFLTYDDPRLQKAANGYVMQAIFHFETGDAFCEDTSCQLYNSHWQSDVIRTQVTSPRLCGYHQDVLGLIKDTVIL